MRYTKKIIAAGRQGNWRAQEVLAYYAAQEFPEFMWQRSEDQVIRSICESIRSVDRLEIVASTASGYQVGIMVLAEDEDMHVGRCLSVQWQYVLPEYRNAGIAHRFMRTAIQLARQEGYPVLAYSHRVGPGEYSIKYRRINGQKN